MPRCSQLVVCVCVCVFHCVLGDVIHGYMEGEVGDGVGALMALRVLHAGRGMPSLIALLQLCHPLLLL